MTSRFRSNWAKEGPKSTSPTFDNSASNSRTSVDDRRRDYLDNFSIPQTSSPKKNGSRFIRDRSTENRNGTTRETNGIHDCYGDERELRDESESPDRSYNRRYKDEYVCRSVEIDDTSGDRRSARKDKNCGIAVTTSERRDHVDDDADGIIADSRNVRSTVTNGNSSSARTAGNGSSKQVNRHDDRSAIGSLTRERVIRIDDPFPAIDPRIGDPTTKRSDAGSTVRSNGRSRDRLEKNSSARDRSPERRSIGSGLRIIENNDDRVYSERTAIRHVSSRSPIGDDEIVNENGDSSIGRSAIGRRNAGGHEKFYSPDRGNVEYCVGSIDRRIGRRVDTRSYSPTDGNYDTMGNGNRDDVSTMRSKRIEDERSKNEEFRSAGIGRRSGRSRVDDRNVFRDNEDGANGAVKTNGNRDENGHSKKSRDIGNDENFQTKRSNTKRKTHVKPSPDDFDVQIHRYERALRAPRRDNDSNGKTSFRDQESDLSRKSSFDDRHRSRDPNSGRKSSNRRRDSDATRRGSSEDRDREILCRKSSLKNRDNDNARKGSSIGRNLFNVGANDRNDGLPIVNRDSSESSRRDRDASITRRKTSRINNDDDDDDDDDDEDDDDDYDRSFGKQDRHSRPLTPPKIVESEDRTDSRDRRAGISVSSLSKDRRRDNDDDYARNFVNDHNDCRGKKYDEIEATRPERDRYSSASRRVVSSRSFNESRSDVASRGGRIDVADRKSSLRDHADDDGLLEDGRNSGFSTIERNGTTVIRIRANSESPVGHPESRSRRRTGHQEVIGTARYRRYEDEAEDEDEDDDEPVERDDRHDLSRREYGVGPKRLWSNRDGGVQITDLDDGQPCLHCGETCPGFSPHSWRKNCTSCKCPREAHDVCHEEWVSVRDRLGLKADGPNSYIGFDPKDKGLTWAPPGLSAGKVEDYFSMLPEISVPRIGSPGERHRDRQLATQLPKQDLATAYCRHLDSQHSASADKFMALRNELSLDIGTVIEIFERDQECGLCHEPLKYGSLAVSAIKLGQRYHPSCFQCIQCRELLVDLAYCVHDDTLYCERHYAEQLKPRCAACDELIFSGEYTKAMNKDWHSGHFCCWQCDESLTGQRYVLRDEHPYCIKCYESVFANGCEECNKIIGIDSKDLSYKDKHWHEACFLCNKCRVSLVDKQFGSKVDKIYCGNCYDAQFASRCDGCGEIFRAGTKKMEYKTRQWHEKCFCCVVCKNPIGTKSFIPREQEIYCAGCYEDKFATRCVKCNKIITSGGVTYKNEPWHRDCFTCSNCDNSLAGQRFTSRDDKPYCAECFGELFAKRCTACTKPITGIGGTRFISFEDRHWHNNCFICAFCNTSLVGRGFITDAEDIICPECAKKRISE